MQIRCEIKKGKKSKRNYFGQTDYYCQTAVKKFKEFSPEVLTPRKSRSKWLLNEFKWENISRGLIIRPKAKSTPY